MIDKKKIFRSFFQDILNLKLNSKKTFKPSINNIYRIKKINGVFVLICPGINNFYNKNIEILDIVFWYILNKVAINFIYKLIDKNTIIVGSLYNFYQDPFLLKFCSNELIFIQHGGSYGEYKVNRLEEFERNHSKHFILWNFVCENGVVQTRYGVFHKIYNYINSLIFWWDKNTRYIFSASANSFELISGPRDHERLIVEKFQSSSCYHFHPESPIKINNKNMFKGSTLKYIKKNDTVIFDGPGHTSFYFCYYLKIKTKIYYSSNYDQYLLKSFTRNFDIQKNFMTPIKQNSLGFSLFKKLCKII